MQNATIQKCVTNLIESDSAIVKLIDMSVTCLVDVRPCGSLNLKLNCKFH